MNIKQIIQDTLISTIEFLSKKVGTYMDNLPVATKEHIWDEASAKTHMEHLCTSPNTGKINWIAYSKGFMWYDSANPELLGSYKLPFCDVINGNLTIIPKALYAIAVFIDRTQIPETDRVKVKSLLAKYYIKIGEVYNG